MTRKPSPLHKRLGLAAGQQLFGAYAGGLNISDKIRSITIRRGSADLESYSPATATIETTANLALLPGESVSAVLSFAAAQTLAAAGQVDAISIMDRWIGRLATQTAHDTRQGRRGTTITSSAWSAVLTKATDTWVPPSADPLSAGLEPLCRPAWGQVIPQPLWLGNSDYWPSYNAADPLPKALTANDYLSLLKSRLYLITDRRDGSLAIRAANNLLSTAATAAAAGRTVRRSHVLAPTQWTQPAEHPSHHRVFRLLPNATIVNNQWGDPTDQLVELRWEDTVSATNQYQRVAALNYATQGQLWRLPSLTFRIDQLIASPLVGHRRAAGMILNLNIGDAIPLGADWPTAIRGVHICTGLTETITHQGWTITAQLVPHYLIIRTPSPTVVAGP